MKYLFIGEKRSQRAIEMNVRWQDGRLAAKQLFDALDYCGIDKNECSFVNLFEPLRHQGILHSSHKLWIIANAVNGRQIVAMGNKVSKELTKKKISHVKIIHPAAKGTIRTKHLYLNHVKSILQPPLY